MRVRCFGGTERESWIWFGWASDESVGTRLGVAWAGYCARTLRVWCGQCLEVVMSGSLYGTGSSRFQFTLDCELELNLKYEWLSVVATNIQHLERVKFYHLTASRFSQSPQAILFSNLAKWFLIRFSAKGASQHTQGWSAISPCWPSLPNQCVCIHLFSHIYMDFWKPVFHE
jgi:hypothetical protein